MKRLIVDGYNVIHSTATYAAVAERGLDSARAALLADVAGYAASGWHATIVFDGGSNPESRGEVHEVAGVDVIFSPFRTEADAVIEKLAREARERGDEVHVVTSDAQTQWAVFGSSVMRRSSAEFAGEIGDERAAWDEHSLSGSRGSRVEERIDPDVRAVLEKWARGKS